MAFSATRGPDGRADSKGFAMLQNGSAQLKALTVTFTIVMIAISVVAKI
jgi:hypothetical protein